MDPCDCTLSLDPCDCVFSLDWSGICDARLKALPARELGDAGPPASKEVVILEDDNVLSLKDREDGVNKLVWLPCGLPCELEEELLSLPVDAACEFELESEFELVGLEDCGLLLRVDAPCEFEFESELELVGLDDCGLLLLADAV